MASKASKQGFCRTKWYSINHTIVFAFPSSLLCFNVAHKTYRAKASFLSPSPISTSQPNVHASSPTYVFMPWKFYDGKTTTSKKNKKNKTKKQASQQADTTRRRMRNAMLFHTVNIYGCLYNKLGGARKGSFAFQSVRYLGGICVVDPLRATNMIKT